MKAASWSRVMFSFFAIYSSLDAMTSLPMRLKSKRWQRESIVAGIFWSSVVAKMNMTCGGGSSRVFKSALNALGESMCTSSII